MRIDHHAYQRATRVASFGLFAQIILGVTLLVFGIVFRDTVFQFASLYILCGVLVWVGLIVIFYQHKLERLEALEEDELSATRGGASASFFDSAASENRVAARRLAMMHKWLMPALSIMLALGLGGFAALMLRYMNGIRVGAVAEFRRTDELGWAVAICLGFAVLSFIFSRFIAGMAKQTVWQNLRGGASYMVGNALVLAAVATGIIFRFFQNDSVIEAVGWTIPIFMGFQVLEIILNFILNLYRPRIPGEVPRPAFDSRVLSWFASPDSIVRSLNEAVNYQFGFDVTSSWGYQLLLRSFVWLLAIGVLAMILLNTMVIVEPYQQGVRLRGGALVDNTVYGSGIMWKRPWPLETAAVYDVTRIRGLPLTARQIRQNDLVLWTDDIENSADKAIEPFIVGSMTATPGLAEGKTRTAHAAGESPDQATAAENTIDGELDAASARISNQYSLVLAEIALRYRIKPDAGLIDYLNFASDDINRGSRLTEREQIMKEIALGEVTTHLSRLSLDEVLSPGLTDLTGDLRRAIQAALDARKAGVIITTVDIPLLRPEDTPADSFEELGISHQAARRRIVEMERNLSVTTTYWVGDEQLTARVIAGLEELDELSRNSEANATAIGEKKLQIEQWLRRGGGYAAQLIGEAERDRWVNMMNARAKASELVNQLPQFAAAPELYRQRRIMEVYKQVLPHLRKYIVGVDPSHVNVQMDLQDTNPLLDAASMINKDSK